MLSTATKAAAKVTKELAEHDIVSEVRDAKHRLEDSARYTVEDISARAADAGRKLRGRIDATTDNVTHYADEVQQKIKDNPVPSALIALGAGFLLGLLAKR